MIRVFLGHDRNIPALFSVLSFSIHARASQPVSIAPLALNQLSGVFDRPREGLQSTEFSFSRFLTPYLCDYQGWAIFMDNDMVVVDDIARLWALRDDRFAVQVVKHNHVPPNDTKFLNAAQTRYEKKNWSSVMMFNCAKCAALTPDYVNTATGLELHQFKWLGNDELIGEIPHRWNHLVDYDPPLPLADISNLHYTDGGPYFDEMANCGYADVWREERAAMLKVLQRNQVAGKVA